MKTGMLIREVEEVLGKAAEALRMAGEIEAGIARVVEGGERERLWRGVFGAY